MSIKCNFGVTAEIVADSMSIHGDRLTSIVLTYPRLIHAELLRHRVFSHSVSSSRAIPVNKVDESQRYMPEVWGLNQAGMVAKDEELEPDAKETAQQLWEDHYYNTVNTAADLAKLGLHKQWANRLLEPHTIIKDLCTGTEWSNFIWLRDHKDAQPEIRELAKVVKLAMEESTPAYTIEGYHVPYFTREYANGYKCSLVSGIFTELEAKYISVSLCAQTSYRNLDASEEKANKIFGMLLGNNRLHASPFEHIAKPFTSDEMEIRSEMVNMYRGSCKCILMPEVIENICDQFYFSGNFKGWHQMRKELKGENYKEN